MKVTQDRLEQIILEEVQAALDEKKKKKRKKRKTCKKDRKTGHCIGRTPTGAGYAAIDFTGGHVTSTITEKKKKKSRKKASAKVRNRGTVVFSAKSSKVKDDKDHFPINSEAQARNALARASQYSSVPKWYKGSLKSLVAAVQRKVKAKYKGIKTTKASKKPGKG